jgi:1-acyl-sn-glycerol-3-phosphate acyltransferase
MLRQVGTIATSKLADDLASLRLMLRMLKSGKLIGIFAEGQRSWDGVSLPIIPSTAKLVKLAKVPVLVSLLKGGYMTIPRWSFHGRRGRVVVEHKLAVSAEEVQELSPEEIAARIEAALAHDDSEYQSVKRVPYVSRRPAENLQLSLFYCPACASLNTMYSKGRRFFCRACGYEVEFNLYYRFRRGQTGHPVHHQTIREWSLAQNAFVEELLRDAVRDGRVAPLFVDDGAVMFTGYRLSRLRKQAGGSLSFSLDGLRFAPEDAAERFFPWSEVKALNVVYQDQLEFYWKRTLYVFRFPAHDTSAYKYELCSRMLDRILTEGSGAEAAAGS